MNIKVKTIKDTNYFADGTYKRKLLDTFSTVGVATVIVRTVLAPLERWKIIRQTQSVYPLRVGHFKSFFQYLRRVPSQQGSMAFWRGNGAHCWLYFTQVLVQFGIYENLKANADLLASEYEGESMKFVITRVGLPLVASFIAQLFTYPIDTARVRLAMQYHKNPKDANFTCIRKCIGDINTHEQFRKVYRGFLLSNLIAFMQFNLMLETINLFDIISSNFHSQSSQTDPLKSVYNSNWFAMLFVTTLLHPLDTLRKMVQLNNMSRPAIFPNVRGAVQYLQQNSSILTLMNGMTAYLCKTLLFAPLYAVCIMALRYKGDIEKENRE